MNRREMEWKQVREDHAMVEHEGFPLVTGHLSLDLVNTEVVRRGNRHNLLATFDDLARWIAAMEQAGGVAGESLPEGCSTPDALHALLALREALRRQFERIADGNEPADGWKVDLEARIARAPFAYKVMNNALVPVPMGAPPDALASLVAWDALRLLASGELLTLRRCANPDCVLLFMDASGRRKWCSMKICGNRMKVARHQSRKSGQK
jgi:predicted RNA-binding Zn ribbon-like protein